MSSKHMPGLPDAIAALLAHGWTAGPGNSCITGECYLHPDFPEKDMVILEHSNAVSVGPRNHHWYRAVMPSRMLPRFLDQMHRSARDWATAEQLRESLEKERTNA